MKSIKFLYILFLPLILFTGCAATKAQLSSPTRLLISEYNTAKEKARIERRAIILPEKLINDYALRLENHRYVANGLLTVDENVEEKNLNEIGVTVNTKTKSVWTATIPLDNIDKLKTIKGVQFIDIGIKAFNR